MMQLDVELDLESFERWVKSKSDLSYVGRRYAICDCPLANYLREATGRFVDVGDEEIDVFEECFLNDISSEPLYTFPLPAWAISFIRMVDADPFSGKGVLKETALSILEFIKKN